MSDVLWDKGGVQFLRNEDGKYAVSHAGYMSWWVENPQELASYARSCYPEHGPLRAEITMFLKDIR